jgi:hypothetical protein
MGISVDDPARSSSKGQSFDASGWTDAASGAGLDCTIQNGSFNQTVSGVVHSGETWTATFGDPAHGLVKVGKNYTITARLSAGGSGSVDEIEIVGGGSTDIECTNVKRTEKAGGLILTIAGKVKAKSSFNAINVLVYVHDKGRAAVAAAGWVYPIPENGKWQITLPSPKAKQIVVHMLGVKGEQGVGQVVTRVTQRVK